MEIVGPSRRTLAYGVRAAAWPMGTMCTSLFAYYFQDWNWFQLSISVIPFVIALITAL